MHFGEVQNIHPRTHVRGVLWYWVKAKADRGKSDHHLLDRGKHLGL